MANSNRGDHAPSSTPPENPQKQRAAEQAPNQPQALPITPKPPIKQVNPDHEGLNPDHLGPAQPRKPGE